MTIQELDALRKKVGFTGFVVTKDGTMESDLLGLVTKRDTDFLEQRGSTPVSEAMTKRAELVTAEEGIELAAANQVIRSTKKGKLPILNKEGRLVALMTRTDLQKAADYPLATKDKEKRL
eukprot:CAMPEP_0170585534 /NCGR_PEP_ID=MMETSP0224-20130122/9266_1 /TAXON_ID=285029 /ORGANISM="Togula jolla, Strain CCCM 725" /LENGTH=119 /DNA_ID=CAMNT_0010909027 /DNA_START=50 /DNA_END=405 /DNA_ORIENTATION=+